MTTTIVCEFCGRTARAARVTRRYCFEACKVAAYRRRHKRSRPTLTTQSKAGEPPPRPRREPTDYERWLLARLKAERPVRYVIARPLYPEGEL